MKEYCLAMVIKQDYWHATISLGQIPTKIHVHSIFKQTKSHVFFDKICQHNYNITRGFTRWYLCYVLIKLLLEKILNTIPPKNFHCI